MRHTRAHTNNRRSHHALTATKAILDKETGKLRLPHRVDESTGMYRGKKIFEPKVKAVKIKEAHGTHHEHVHTDEKKEEGSKGIVGKLTGGAKAKSRSGIGGGGS